MSNTGQPAQGAGGSLFKNLLIWIAIGLGLVAIFSRYGPAQQQMPQLAARIPAAIALLRPCEPLPAGGSSYLIDPALMKHTDVLYAGLEVQNRHHFPMVVVLSDPTEARRYQAVSVLPDTTAQISMPIGHYGMQVLVGSNWCNLDTGFSDGARVSINGGVAIQAGVTTHAQFTGSGPRPVQFSLVYNITRPMSAEDVRPPAEVTDKGSLELQQTREGHYFSSGTVNGFPVVFMIDTGATTVSVSSAVASRAGIQGCVQRMASTANGKILSCEAIAPELTFGGFRLTNVAVNVMPNMTGHALLGMNVLRNFHLEQIDKKMRISTP